MHTTFSKAVDTFVVASNKQGSAFGTLADYCYSATAENCKAGMHPDEVCDVLKNDLKANESAYKVAHPRVTEFPPAYRSAKSVILSAIKAGICLKDENGKLKGKTALEQEIKEGKEVKSELQKFQSSIDTASKIFAKIDNLGDIRQAKALTAVLVDMILKAERASMVVVDEQKAA